MKLSILILLIAASAFAQASTTLTLTGPATVRPGSTVQLLLSANGATDTGAAGFQWTINFPSGYTATATPGAAATAAGKTILACTADNSLCLLLGMNTTAIPGGAIANYAVKVPLSAAPSPAPFSLSGLIAVNPTGDVIPTAAGTPYAPIVLMKQDLNGDGKVDSTDLQIMIDQVIASQSNSARCVDDQNGDGKCDLLDVINVLLKALGQ
jgi:hypothetical protein